MIHSTETKQNETWGCDGTEKLTEKQAPLDVEGQEPHLNTPDAAIIVLKLALGHAAALTPLHDQLVR